MYPDNVKTVTRAWLDEVNEYGLMVLYLDDGGLTGEGNRKIKLSVQGFGEDGVAMISEYFREQWDLENTIEHHTSGKTNKTYATLIFYQNDTKKFLPLIMKHVPTVHMLYKFRLKYADSKLQQDWISELKQTLPHFAEAIDKMYAKSDD